MEDRPNSGGVAPVFSGPAAELSHATIRVNGRELISDVSWRIEYGEHWVVLGCNGAGKSTAMSLLACTRHPSNGTVNVLGHRLGTVDLRELRCRVALVSTAQRLLDEEGATALTVVLTGFSGTIQPMWHKYHDKVRERAREQLELVGLGYLAHRPIRVCSQGERARIRIARALMADPVMLLLDEPFAGLDMPSREYLIETIQALARERPELTTVTVSHHLEEVPGTTTRALLMRDGSVMTHGDPTEVLTSANLSECFGRSLSVHRVSDRWSVQA